MNQNNLLLVLLLVFGVVCYHTFHCYSENKTVSDILCDSQINDRIIFFVIILGLLHFFYEMNHKDIFSTILICILYINLYGLTIKNEDYKIHYVFTFMVFISMFIYMVRQYYLIDFNHLLLLSLTLEIVMGIYLLFIIVKFLRKEMKIKINIFFIELAYIFNFIGFIILLHFYKKKQIDKSMS